MNTAEVHELMKKKSHQSENEKYFANASTKIVLFSGDQFQENKVRIQKMTI